MVEAKGKEKLRPNNLKRTSPGKRPIPSFSSQGSKLENTTTARKMVNTQRNKAYSRFFGLISGGKFPVLQIQLSAIISDGYDQDAINFPVIPRHTPSPAL